MDRRVRGDSRRGVARLDGPLQLALLGPLTITRTGAPLTLAGPKRRALLILLALEPGVAVGRDRIVDALWPQRSTGREESTLRVHVSHLRDVLEPDRNGTPRVITTVGSGYMLDSQAVDVDVARFDLEAREGRALLRTDPAAALDHLNQALALWHGRPLQDVEYEEFAQASIRRLEAARVEAIEDRADALVELGEDLAAIEDLEALVRTEPTRERPVLLLMRALYRTGRHSDALRVARRHARHLAESGLEPSPRLGVLEQRILQHDRGLLPAGTTPRGDVKPGRSVRGYELREEVGRGAVGTVYRAFQASVSREVAVKAIHVALAESPEFVRRFAEEARIVANLEHPHIVPLHDFWRDPAGAFLVMRWMDGGSIDARIGRPWPEDGLARVFGQLTDALAYAHSAGAVHRDVKATNVLFDAAGNAYLSDFGLAVTGTDGGPRGRERSVPATAPYASPQRLHGEGPTVASDVYALGMLLAEVASGCRGEAAIGQLVGGVREVAVVATAADPADRYPDVTAFRAALLEAVDTTTVAVPRRLRRNPYKGLAPFTDADRADFYGRDDVVETLVDAVATNGLTAVIGASGSGKSSLVRAGLVPALRDGALLGSDEWSLVQMVPGSDPFEEFHLALRAVAVGSNASPPSGRSRELRAAFAAALDAPSSRALLVVDQLEELFSSEVDDGARDRFVDDLVDLAIDPSQRVRVVVTLRADFADRALAHPRLGELVARSSLLLGPMLPEQVEEVIRRPAARVGVQVEPGLTAEIVRDVASAVAYLPLLQYVLAELFERRTEDRLTVQAYRALGGVQGVLERRAEVTFASLGPEAQTACRQLFLRMVHLGGYGEETRRRLPLSELRGLGRRADVEAALEAFSAARLVTYDRDPVTRSPTVEVAHETVIRRWARYRVWIDEARADVLAHRRLAGGAQTWAEADEDPAYLLTGGPLATAIDVAAEGRIALNDLEARYLDESRRADEVAREHEADRRRQEAALEHRARRRLRMGVAAASVAVVIAIVAAFAVVQRQRADDLAAAQERQNTARALAAAAVAQLAASDPELSLLLAIEAADLSLAAGEDVLPEVVDALHRAVINPRPAREIAGAGTALGGRLLDFSVDGALLAMLAADGGVAVVDPYGGEELGRLPPVEPTAVGVDLHPDGQRILSIHPDGVRQWRWDTGALEVEILHPEGVAVTTATYAPDGAHVATGGEDGIVRVWRGDELVAELAEEGHGGEVAAIDFDPSGTRVASAGRGGDADGPRSWTALVWDVSTERVVTRARTDTILLPIADLTWSPVHDVAAVTTMQGETFLLDTATGERLNSFGNGQHRSTAVAFDPTGHFVITAGVDGIGRLYGTWVGGESFLALPSGGVPLRDARFAPRSDGLTIASVGVDGNVRVWEDVLGSELPLRVTPGIYPQIVATPDGGRYLTTTPFARLESDEVPSMQVVDASTGETLISRAAVPWGGERRPALARDGSLAAFAGVSGDIELTDVATGATRPIVASATWTASLDLSPDATLVAGGGIDGSISIWDVESGRLMTRLHGHGDREPANRGVPAGPPQGAGPELLQLPAATTFRVDEVRFHPDGDVLASAGFDGTVRVWDLASGTGRVLHTFDHEVYSLAYSPDGDRLAVSDRTGTVVLLDAASGEVVAVPEPVSGRTELVFSPDGRTLAGAGPGPFAHLWDVDTGRVVRRLRGASYQPQGVAFVNGGTELRVAGGDGVDRGYALDPLRLVDIARSHVTRTLAEEECRQYLGEPGRCADASSAVTR